jgi:hypothetical protein
MRATEMLTGAGAGAAAATTTPSTASVGDLAGGVPSAGAGGNFPLGAALLAFAIANFVNVLSIWCALPPSLPL